MTTHPTHTVRSDLPTLTDKLGWRCRTCAICLGQPGQRPGDLAGGGELVRCVPGCSAHCRALDGVDDQLHTVTLGGGKRIVAQSAAVGGSAISHAVRSRENRVLCRELVFASQWQRARSQASDISPLGSAVNLRTLYLNDTKVIDLSALAGLGNLKRFYIKGTHVEDTSMLDGLPNLQITQ